MHFKNYQLRILGSSYDAIRFGSGQTHLLMVPGLGDGVTTVKGRALLGNLMYSRYAKKYTVTIISRRNEPDYLATTETMARDLALCMEALGIEKAHVVGVSLGGMIAQHLAADHPAMVDKLVLVVTAPRANEMIRKNLTRWVSMAQTGAFTGLMMDISEKAHTAKKLKLLRPVYSHMGAAVRKMDPERFAIQARACAEHDALEKLDRIQAPTLIIGGGQDRTVGCDGSHLLHRYIGGSILKLYPDQGHALYTDEPDFHKTLLAFLEDAPAEEDHIIRLS